jgi:hypothetical protein
MEPYFYKIEKDILTTELKDFIVEKSLDNKNRFIPYRSRAHKYVDGNNFYFGSLITQHPEIIKVVASCSIKCYPVILLHKPNTRVIKHVDDPNKRNCVLSIPLYPKENYSPTWFWEKEGSSIDWKDKPLKLLATCNFANMQPAFLNTQIVHSLDTFDSYRLNFQLCFNDPFEKVVELYKQNKLFN